MKALSADAIKSTLAAHRKWATGEDGDVRANLSDANLSEAYLRGAYLSDANLSDANLRGANLSDANLSGANLSDANLRDADFSGADLRGANLRGAYLRDANLIGANLSGANLSGANLSGAYLSGANLSGAYLSDANLSDANLSDANLSEAYLRDADFSGANLRGADHDDSTRWPAFWVCPEVGAFTGWKKLRGDIVAELLVPADARRVSSVIGRKCRAEFVHVLALRDESGNAVAEAFDLYSGKLSYTPGNLVRPDSFDDDFTVECAHGLHFYITRQEAAEQYG